jgi:transcriptional regulator with XRE-family HTH domain
MNTRDEAKASRTKSDPREKTLYLADKLTRIRAALGLSQTQLLRRLNLTAYYHHTRISLWERGRREPPIKVLLRYARLAGVSTDVLIDDDLELELPKKLSAGARAKKKAAGKKARR